MAKIATITVEIIINFTDTDFLLSLSKNTPLFNSRFLYPFYPPQEQDGLYLLAFSSPK